MLQKEVILPKMLDTAKGRQAWANAWKYNRSSAVCEDSDLESAEVSLGKVCSLQGLGMFTRFETSTKYSLLHAILIYCCDPAVTGS